MSDLIDRQVALDAIDALVAMQRRCTSEVALIQGSKIWQQIKDLPSAQPDCSDCIKHGGDWDCDHVHCHKGESAQPEIIRCKDCKHWTQSIGKMKGYGLGRCDFHDTDLVTCNGYCYWAERRSDG